MIIKKIYSKLKNPLKSYLNRFGYYKNILKHDAKLNYSINQSDFTFIKNGYKINRNLLSKEDLYHFNKFYEKNQILFDEKFLYLLKFIENKYEKSIKEYLGDNYILVNFTVMKTSKLTKSVSECWHTDNLGHKINLLICVDGDGSIPTFYKPGTNKKKYFPSIFEEMRMSFNINLFLTDSAKIIFDHKKGDCTLFDANGRHRGSYQAGTMDRKIIIIEFMNKDKFLDLRGHNENESNKSNIKYPYRETNEIKDYQLIPEKIFKDLLRFNFFYKDVIKNHNGKQYFQYSNLVED